MQIELTVDGKSFKVEPVQVETQEERFDSTVKSYLLAAAQQIIRKYLLDQQYPIRYNQPEVRNLEKIVDSAFLHSGVHVASTITSNDNGRTLNVSLQRR